MLKHYKTCNGDTVRGDGCSRERIDPSLAVKVLLQIGEEF